MDKAYLIHDIKLNDNPADGHWTTDILISNLTFDLDTTADITIKYYNNGVLDSEISTADVSLTGAGGGEILPVEKCTITFENIRVEGDPLTYPVTECEITFDLQADVYYFTGATATYMVEDGTYDDSKIELIIPTDHENPTKIISMVFVTENGNYVWDTALSPIISGDATFDSDSSAVYVTGDCTLSPDTFLD